MVTTGPRGARTQGRKRTTMTTNMTSNPGSRTGRAAPRRNLRLAGHRLYRGWTQADLAERIGTTKINVSRWERGSTAPNRHFRARLCSAFALSEADLGLMEPGEAVGHILPAPEAAQEPE